jgi:hypothetical protein
MNWIHKPTAWEQGQMWKERRAAAREHFESANTAAVSGFATAQANLSVGLGNITMQRALERIQAAHEAKVAELQKSMDVKA